MRSSILVLLTLVYLAWAHSNHDQTPLSTYDSHLGLGSSGQTWIQKYGPQIDQPFSGPLSFSHLPYARCLEDESMNFDVALLGMPFDTGVTYRPGARFGPYAIRSGSRRQREVRGYTMSWGNNPYALGYKVMDCGDVSVLS
jgi:agmatinase